MRELLFNLVLKSIEIFLNIRFEVYSFVGGFPSFSDDIFINIKTKSRRSDPVL